MWCKLGKKVDTLANSNQSSSTQFSQSIQLYIWDRGCLASGISIIDKLNPILIALQIYSLYVFFDKVPISTFLKFIHLLSNLDSLRVTHLPPLELTKLSTEDAESLRLVSNSNKITKVRLSTEFGYAKFLIDLCPQIEYLEVPWMVTTDLERFVRIVLMKTITCIPHLHSLQLNNRNVNDEMIHKLQRMIDFEKLRTDFTIKCSDGAITLLLKSQ